MADLVAARDWLPSYAHELNPVEGPFQAPRSTLPASPAQPSPAQPSPARGERRRSARLGSRQAGGAAWRSPASGVFVVAAAVVFEADLAVEVAVLVGAGTPVKPGLAAEGYPAAAGAALLVVPVIQVAGFGGAAEEPGQPPVVRRPADPVSRFASQGHIVAQVKVRRPADCLRIVPAVTAPLPPQPVPGRPHQRQHQPADRWAGWHREPFTTDSRSHVSVREKPAAPDG
jgi:hypothetical protein